jgi:hypothetical protein
MSQTILSAPLISTVVRVDIIHTLSPDDTDEIVQEESIRGFCASREVYVHNMIPIEDIISSMDSNEFILSFHVIIYLVLSLKEIHSRVLWSK